jgi:hypothetical protein
MIYRDAVTLADETTIGAARTVANIIVGVGRIVGHDWADGTIRFEMESEPGEVMWDFAMRVRDLADELAVYRVDMLPTRDKVTG